MAFVNPEGEKAFKRAAEAACNLPNLQSLQLNAAVVTEKKLTQEQLEDLNLLLQWLMLENSQRSEFRLASPSNAPPLPFQRPTFVFESIDSSPPLASDLICYHGTSFNRLWSILHRGLHSSSPERPSRKGGLSNNLLSKNGQIFGHGVYSTTDPNVALTFSETCYQPWLNSNLGAKLRVVLICRLDRSRDDGKGNKGKASSSNQDPVPDDLPPHYLLVRDTEALKISHVLIWCDEKHKRNLRKDSPTTWSFFGDLDFFRVAILAYVAFLLFQSLSNNRNIQALLHPQ